MQIVDTCSTTVHESSANTSCSHYCFLFPHPSQFNFTLKHTLFVLATFWLTCYVFLNIGTLVCSNEDGINQKIFLCAISGYICPCCPGLDQLWTKMRTLLATLWFVVFAFHVAGVCNWQLASGLLPEYSQEGSTRQEERAVMSAALLKWLVVQRHLPPYSIHSYMQQLKDELV